MGNWTNGSSLLRDLRPQIENAIAYYEKNRRIAIWRSILSAFASMRTDIHQLAGENSDIDEILADLPQADPDPPEVDPFTIKGDTTGIGLPERLELHGGPFDGASLWLGTGIHERPPARIDLHCDTTESRGTIVESYISVQATHDSLDETTRVDAFSYQHRPSS